MPAKGNLMTQKKKAPSDFDSFIESYVLDKMQQRGGAALTSEDLSDFIKSAARNSLRVRSKASLTIILKTTYWTLIKLKNRILTKTNSLPTNVTERPRKPSLPIWVKLIWMFPEIGIQHLNRSVSLSGNAGLRALMTKSSVCTPEGWVRVKSLHIWRNFTELASALNLSVTSQRAF